MQLDRICLEVLLTLHNEKGMIVEEWYTPRYQGEPKAEQQVSVQPRSRLFDHVIGIFIANAFKKPLTCTGRWLGACAKTEQTSLD